MSHTFARQSSRSVQPALIPKPGIAEAAKKDLEKREKLNRFCESVITGTYNAEAATLTVRIPQSLCDLPTEDIAAHMTRHLGTLFDEGVLVKPAVETEGRATTIEIELSGSAAAAYARRADDLEREAASNNHDLAARL